MYRSSWNSAVQSAGFNSKATASLAALSEPEADEVDAVYRIAFPAALSPVLRTGTPQFTFIVNEYGLKPSYLSESLPDLGALTRDGNAVITPSTWSRRLLIDFGLDAKRVQVVPHGVCRKTFSPMPEVDRRALRHATGFNDGHYVFSNVGIPSWNKGVDQLLVAFARVRGLHSGARLILKNHRSLYGINSSTYFQAVNHSHPGLLTTEVMSSILLIDDNMDQEDLRKLFVCSDCYVSPYRAEGFNLPVLEAMSCGTPVIVTAGGATDDYCEDHLATRVESTLRSTPDQLLPGGRFLEITQGALIDAMLHSLEQGGRRLSGTAWESSMEALSWHRVANLALEFIFPGNDTQTDSASNETAGAKASSVPAIADPQSRPKIALECSVPTQQLILPNPSPAVPSYGGILPSVAAC